MKIFKLVIAAFFFVNYCTAQKISIAPHVGMNLNSFGYPKSNIATNSILSYPKDINLGYQVGGDLTYTVGNKKHVLSISSVPLGVQFRGDVKNIEMTQTRIIFKRSSNDRQPLLSYQLFFSNIISKPGSIRNISFFYGGGMGVGFNRSKDFYKLNNVPEPGGAVGTSDSLYHLYEYTKNRLGAGYFVMPEIGFSFFNKDDNPLVNISFFYYIGLKTQASYNLILRYGKEGTNYNIEERPILGTRGGFYGAKLSFPFSLYTLKKTRKKTS